MGVLTEHTTRLCLDIATMREARQALLAQMRRGTRLRRVAVSEMLARFSQAQAQAGRRMKTDLTSSLRRLRGGVDRLRKEVTAEVVGVRQAWLGTIPTIPGAIRIQTPFGVIADAGGVEAMEGPPQVAPEAEPEREGVEEVPEAPEEIREPGIEEGQAGAAAKTEGRARKRKKRH